MIYLKLDYAINFTCDYSIFVTFNYNSRYVELIKTLKERNFNYNTKSWEIPYKYYTDLIALLNTNNIPYNGEEFFNQARNFKEAIDKKNLDNNFVIDLNTVKFKTEPFSYQKAGIKYMLEHDKCLIADEQGLGKTYQTLNTAVLKKGGNHCLIIAGYDTLQFNWALEVQKHTNEQAYVLGQRTKKNGKVYLGSLKDRLDDIKNLDKIKEFFIITAPTTLRQCEKQEYIKKNGKKGFNKIYTNALLLQEWCKKGEIGRIIYDEIQTAKNYEASQTEALLYLKSAPYKIAATGTPLMNKNLDLYPLLVWLGYEDRNYYEFKNTYCIMGGFKGKEIIGNKNTKELHDKLSQFMIRRKKEDVLDLPEKIYIDEILELDGKQYALYEKQKRLIKQQFYSMKGNKVALLSSTLSLRKLTCHSKWVDLNTNESVKFERILQLIYESSQNNKKTIVFSNFATPINWLYELLKPYNPAMIIGETKDRMKEVDKFQTDPSCFVILGTIGAMGTGLTLNQASNVIFLDEPWNRSLKDQAIDRAHRIGTKNNINIYTLICKNTIDEGVHATVNKKGRLADEVVDGVTTEELENIINNF